MPGYDDESISICESTGLLAWQCNAVVRSCRNAAEMCSRRRAPSRQRTLRIICGQVSYQHQVCS